jgi:DNA-binding XRE family transcriptional regulator
MAKTRPYKIDLRGPGNRVMTPAGCVGVLLPRVTPQDVDEALRGMPPRTPPRRQHGAIRRALLQARLIDGGIGERIRQTRLEARLTQAELCRAAEIKQQLLSEIELGLRNPAPATIGRIARALEMPALELAGGEEYFFAAG